MLFHATTVALGLVWTAPHQRHVRRAPAPAMSADPEKVYRRAEFWEPERCTLLDVANVLGRWEAAAQWGVRTQFSIVAKDAVREGSMAQGATKERYEMARRNNAVERVALVQNINKLPFKNDKLAASFGKTAKDFQKMPLNPAAVNTVFDALSESKSSMVVSAVADQRRSRMVNEDGTINEGAFAAGLYKSRAIVSLSWVFYGKAQIYGVFAFGKIFIDKT